jgi:excisionase family DNA binding protein
MNEKPATVDRLLTVTEVARLAAVSVPTVYRRVATGEIPAIKVGERGGPIRIPEGEFRAWLYGDPEIAA